MCERLSELAEAMRTYASRFDAALLLGSEASQAVELAATIEKIAATIKASAAARAEDCGAWARSGDKSPAHHLARITGSSVGAAVSAIETARKLEELPEAKAAAAEGKLSPAQSQAIASAASADPSAEHELVKKAETLSPAELREEADKVRAAADHDAEARRKRIHAERSIRTYTDSSGVANLHWRDNPERIAQAMAVLQPVADKLFEEARREERREPPGAYLADAAFETLCGTEEERGKARRGNAKAKVIVRVDLDALLRGWAEEDETCELVGFGPIAVSVVEEMIASGAFICGVATKGCDIASVVHLGRAPTAVMETALQWLYPTCAVEGCGQVGRLERDHRDDWSKTRQTFFLGLDLLCPHHHGLKTTKNWALVVGTGKRAFVDPDDPRHPRHANAPPDAA